jgi:DNA-binding XRE family transcriptional regulator
MAITLAQLIREARIRMSPMTQKELGELVGTSLENITSIENGRNKQASPDVVAGLSRNLNLRVIDIYSAITGNLNHYPWDMVGELDLKDPELELMFRQVDNILEGESKERVKAFIRFTLDEERRKQRAEKDDKRRSK